VSALLVGQCDVCGARRFPIPLWCDVCGSDRIEKVGETSGTVAETTVVRHAPGRRLEPVAVGTVRLSGGGVVIARLAGGVREGDRVRVAIEDGAPVAQP
jgi:uncharacterized OB-fold protein